MSYLANIIARWFLLFITFQVCLLRVEFKLSRDLFALGLNEMLEFPGSARLRKT